MNSSKIEELAITFLKDIFADSDFIKTSFSEGDKKPLVDGDISIYRDKRFRNEDVVDHIPVQIKGKTVENISPKSPSFPLKKDYLEGLKSIGGVLLLVVFLQKDAPKKRQAFYAHLFRFQIENLLMEMKPDQKQKSIPLKKLPDDPEHLLRICYQARDIKRKSSYAIPVSPEVLSDIEELSFTSPDPLDFSKPRTIQIGTHLSKDNIDAVLEIKTKNGAKILQNATAFLLPLEYTYQPVEFPISSGEITFHDSLKKRLSEKRYTLALSPGLSLTINRDNNECKIDLSVQDILYYAYQDLEFLKSLADSGAVYINGQEALKVKITPEDFLIFNKNYQLFFDLYKLFEILKVDSRLIRLEDLTEDTIEELIKYVQIFVYKRTINLKSEESSLRLRNKVTIGDNHLHFIFIYNEDTGIWRCFNLVSAQMKFLVNNNPYSISAYDLLMMEGELGKTLNLHPENLIVSYKQILDHTPNAKKQSFRDIATDTVTEFITGADLNPLRRQEFLSMAKKLNEWLLSCEPENQVFLINQWQILHREGLFTPELEKEIRALIRSLTNKDIRCEIACAILLGRFDDMQDLMEQLPQTERKLIESWPIYYLFEHREGPYEIPDLNENREWQTFLDSAWQEETMTRLKQVAPNLANEKFIIQPPTE
jgi:hypothetical protein